MPPKKTKTHKKYQQSNEPHMRHCHRRTKQTEKKKRNIFILVETNKNNKTTAAYVIILCQKQ